MTNLTEKVVTFNDYPGKWLIISEPLNPPIRRCVKVSSLFEGKIIEKEFSKERDLVVIGRNTQAVTMFNTLKQQEKDNE